MELILVHHNGGLQHQIDYAHAFRDAGCKITPSPNGEADFHVVLGPHFALRHWRHHPNLIYGDRAYWADPQYMTWCWYNRGEKIWPFGPDLREKPDLLPWKTGRDSCLVLADYGDDGRAGAQRARNHFRRVRVRNHPAQARPARPLAADLADFDVVYGSTSTALVAAAIAGCPVICEEPDSAVAAIASTFDEIRTPGRESWLHRLSWRQWSIDEVRDGSALDALMECYESRQAAA